jgi:hypothetical protein
VVSLHVVCESLVALLLSIMAKIIGVEASSWHALVKSWWQFVRFPTWTRNNAPLNSISGSRRLHTRFRCPWIDIPFISCVQKLAQTLLSGCLIMA